MKLRTAFDLGLSCTVLALGAACTASRPARTPRTAGQPAAAAEKKDDEEPAPDPTKDEVALESLSDGWGAHLVIDNGKVGIWTVGAYDVFPQYAVPDVVALDDVGRCYVLVSYSGKWTPLARVHDGKWLGGLAHADVDARIEGSELYVGSQGGNLYQLVSYKSGALDARLIGTFEGREVHTIVGGDLDPRSDGAELLVFTNPGGLWRVSPTGEHGRFVTELLEELPGRVRDAVLLPREPGRPLEIATVSRSGSLALLTVAGDGTHWTTVHADDMGMGRIALRSSAPGEPVVLYSSLDDGRILRHEHTAQSWKSETIYAGPQGPRGLTAGRFDADPSVETIAVFGYSETVQLLSRRASGWEVEDLFRDRDKGHWLATAELDGRNGTDEILGSGYGGRVFLLQRPPGYGLAGVKTDPRSEREAARPASEAAAKR